MHFSGVLSISQLLLPWIILYDFFLSRIRMFWAFANWGIHFLVCTEFNYVRSDVIAPVSNFQSDDFSPLIQFLFVTNNNNHPLFTLFLASMILQIPVTCMRFKGQFSQRNVCVSLSPYCPLFLFRYYYPFEDMWTRTILLSLPCLIILKRFGFIFSLFRYFTLYSLADVFTPLQCLHERNQDCFLQYA